MLPSMHVRKKSFIPIIIIVIFCLITSIAMGAYIGTFDDSDSFLYAALGEFIYFKNNIPMHPFINDPPQTLFGPIYPILIEPLSRITAPTGGAMVAITGVQMLMLFASAGIVGFLAGKLISPKIRWLSALLLVLFPFSVPYATIIMSEIATMFLVSVYLLFLYGWIVKHWKYANPSTLLFLAGILTLTRYVFILLFIINFCIFFFLPVKNAPPFRVAGLLGILMIFGWILVNFQLHGVLALSNVTGRHLYNNVVSTAHIMPPYPDPKTNYFMSKFIEKKWENFLMSPWWVNEMTFNDGILTQKLIDQMYMDVALVTIWHHPLAYIGNAIREFFVIPVTAPLFPETAITHLRECPASTCHILWNSSLCLPALDNCAVRSVFASFIEAEQTLYPYPMIIFLIVACIGIVGIAIRGPLYMRLIAGVFVVQHLFQSCTEWIEGRFLIPLYPLYVLLIIYGVKTAIDSIHRLLQPSKKKCT